MFYKPTQMGVELKIRSDVRGASRSVLLCNTLLFCCRNTASHKCDNEYTTYANDNRQRSMRRWRSCSHESRVQHWRFQVTRICSRRYFFVYKDFYLKVDYVNGIGTLYIVWLTNR